MRERERVGRRAALAIGLWVVVVVSGSWLVWTVIAAAGGSFVGTQGPLPISPGASSHPPAPSRAPSTSAPATATTSRSPAPDTPPPVSSPAARSRTWSGAPGVVTVRCRGARIELGGAAVTASGYAVEVNQRGPQLVQVEFHRRPDGGDLKVVARCRAGSPAFSVVGDD